MTTPCSYYRCAELGDRCPMCANAPKPSPAKTTQDEKDLELGRTMRKIKIESTRLGPCRGGNWTVVVPGWPPVYGKTPEEALSKLSPECFKGKGK